MVCQYRKLANRTEFGLGAAVWKSDVDRARKLAREIEAGAEVDGPGEPIMETDDSPDRGKPRSF